MRILKTTFYCWISGLFLLSIVNGVQAQKTLTDTIWVHVTYFDFHADGTNPEFEQRHYSGVVDSMVAKRLDEDSLPVIGPYINLNRDIEYWFRDYNLPVKGAKDKAKKTVPTYSKPRTSTGQDTAVFTGFRDTTYDTAFKNIVFHDSLPFTRVANNPSLYEFVDSTFFPLDGKGFGSENKKDERGVPHNYAFTMALHYNFTKTKNSIQQTFNFTGDDDVWAFIDKQLVMDLGGVHIPASGGFTVSDTLKTNQQYSFDFFFAERHTFMSNIRIQTNLFVHEPPVFKFNIAPDDTIEAGGTAIVTADITMDGEPRPDLAKTTIWSFVDSSKAKGASLWCDTKESNVGNPVHFTAQDAFKYYYIKAAAFDSIADSMVYATVRIYVKPGPPHHLVIEQNPFKNGAFSVKDSLNDEPIDRILISSKDTMAEAYAVVRDSLGNIIGPADSQNAVWSQTDPSISTTGEPNHKYHGIIIRRADNDTTYAVVNQPNDPPIRGDSVIVILSDACIIELRLKNSSGNVVTEITMNTGEKKTFYVEGLLSTTREWTPVDAKWELSQTIESLSPPERNGSWTIDPTKPGHATIILTRPYDNCIDKPRLEVPLTITVEKPNRVDIVIKTPVSERIAGDTLIAIVSIQNSDGLVPGKYCFGAGGNETQQVIYQDTLKNPNHDKTPVPRILVDGEWTNLNMGFTNDIKNNQCFMDGVDTIKFISYFAPYNSKDSTHLLTVDIGANRKDQESFVLIPAILDSIDITDYNHISITNVQEFSSDGEGRYYFSVGYDKYGNKIGDTPSDWKTGGEIRDTSFAGTEKINFKPGKVEITQNGIIISQVKAANGKIIKDQIDVRVLGLPAQLKSASTHDDNGNGYLDRLSLIFDKKVTIDENATSLFQIKNGISNTFNVTKIVPVGDDGKQYSVYLKEYTLPADAQTDWKPLISSNGQDDFSAFKDVSSHDSAAPVVWKAEKWNDKGNDRTKDYLIITLSETVRRANNSEFSESNKPDSTFNVWMKDPSDTSKFILVPLLEGIPGFEELTDNTFKIRMTNGKDITEWNYINIKDQNRSLIDVPVNFPSENNIKQKVIVYSDFRSAVVIPNPTSPSFEHTGPGVLNLRDDRDARRFARDGKGAAINVVLPNNKPGETVTAHIKIYDIAGNIVNTSYNNDFLKIGSTNTAEVGSNTSVDIYWNGSNSKGMKVAPGIYKTVLYFSYSKHSIKNLRFILNIGMKK